MTETRADADADADDVELLVADPATAPPSHVVVRIPDVDGKSDGCRRLTAVEKPPSLCDIILLGCIKALISIWYIGAVIASLYFFVQAIADSTWLDVLLLVLPLGALAALCLFMVFAFCCLIVVNESE